MEDNAGDKRKIAGADRAQPGIALIFTKKSCDFLQFLMIQQHYGEPHNRIACNHSMNIFSKWFSGLRRNNKYREDCKKSGNVNKILFHIHQLL